MIEVLFTESAAGGMQYAKSLSHTIAGASDVLVLADDGSAPTEEELRRARQVEEERRRRAVPMEGSPRDVVCLPLGLSMGDISDPLSDGRAAYLQSTVLIPGREFAGIGRTMVETARAGLARIRAAAEAGEAIRVWYSQNPDELCGFCHLMTELPGGADVRAVGLPTCEAFDDHVTTYTGWGEVHPGHLADFLHQERVLSPTEHWFFSGQWKLLARENAPLRAVVNGRLMGVGADFYDGFILRELGRAGEEFQEARLIGDVLGRYQFGISDRLVAMRIEEFISRGMLTPLSQPPENRPIYHRMLRKEHP